MSSPFIQISDGTKWWSLQNPQSLQEEMRPSHQAKNEKIEDGSWRLTLSSIFLSSCLFSLVNLVILLEDGDCKSPSSRRSNGGDQQDKDDKQDWSSWRFYPFLLFFFLPIISFTLDIFQVPCDFD